MQTFQIGIKQCQIGYRNCTELGFVLQVCRKREECIKRSGKSCTQYSYSNQNSNDCMKNCCAGFENIDTQTTGQSLSVCKQNQYWRNVGYIFLFIFVYLLPITTLPLVIGVGFLLVLLIICIKEKCQNSKKSSNQMKNESNDHLQKIQNKINKQTLQKLKQPTIIKDSNVIYLSSH